MDQQNQAVLNEPTFHMFYNSLLHSVYKAKFPIISDSFHPGHHWHGSIR